MKTIPLDILGRLNNIWEIKNWKFQTKENSDQAFNRICELVSLLDREEQDIFVSLTDSYSYYPFGDYADLLTQAILKINSDFLIGIEKVILVPLVKPNDVKRNKSKSGHSLLYTGQYISIPMNKNFLGISLEVLVNPSILRSDHSENKLLVILLDDFIGSGDTAEKAVINMKESLNPQDEVLIVSLVAMQQGVDYLLSCSITILYAVLLQKCIEKNPLIVDKVKAYKLIDDIWVKHLDVNKDYKFGYKKSEALVTMIRTPNNTLPMYWCEKSRSGSEWPSPFTR